MQGKKTLEKVVLISSTLIPRCREEVGVEGMNFPIFRLYQQHQKATKNSTQPLLNENQIYPYSLS